MTEPLLHTALYDTHLALGGKMVPFAGWKMPIQYRNGILAEARAVRSSAGIFDVSHMGRLWLMGEDASALLDWVLTAGVPGLARGRGRYCLVCTEQGGILDDAIVYRLDDQVYLLVCNASNRSAVWDWLAQWQRQRFPRVQMEDRTFQVGMVAFQGPATLEALERLSPGLVERVRPFRIRQAEIAGIPALAARTGYTGEDGFEIMPDASQSAALVEALLEAGGVPCGLGSRDILRLEAGLPLHGNDITIETNPYEASLERFVAGDKRESVYSAALERALRQGMGRKLTGFVMVERGVPRHGYPIFHEGKPIGEVTSGGYSPTLDSYIGMGYVSGEFAAPRLRFTVDVRGRRLEAETVALPFYSRRRG